MGYVAKIVLKARQEYMSTTIQAYALYTMLMHEMTDALTIAHLRKSAAHIAGDMTIYMASHLPEDFSLLVKPTSGKRPVDTNYKGSASQDMIYLRLNNESRMTTMTARTVKDPRSFSYSFVHLSELSSYWEDMNSRKQADEMVGALMPTIPLGINPYAAVFMESTAKGMDGIFYETWLRSESGDGLFEPVFIPWYWARKYTIQEKPDEKTAFTQYQSLIKKGDSRNAERFAQMLSLSKDEREIIGNANLTLTWGHMKWRRRIGLPSLGDDPFIFRQEYPTTAKEAFLVSGQHAFSSEALTVYIENAPHPSWAGEIDLDPNRHPVRNEGREEYRVYETFNPTHDYVIGWDAAAGGAAANSAGKADDHAGAVLDRMTQAIVAVYNSNVPDPVQAGRIAYAIGSEYGFPPIVCDRDGNGRAVLGELQRLEYPRIYTQWMFDYIIRSNKDVPGFAITPSIRKHILNTLRNCIAEKRLDMPDLATLNEMKTMIINIKPGTRQENILQTSGKHDDLVFAVAIAWAAHGEKEMRIRESNEVKRQKHDAQQTIMIGDRQLVKRTRSGDNKSFNNW